MERWIKNVQDGGCDSADLVCSGIPTRGGIFADCVPAAAWVSCAKENKKRVAVEPNQELQSRWVYLDDRAAEDTTRNGRFALQAESESVERIA